MKKMLAILGSTTVITALAALANAQDTLGLPVDAPSKAVEIGVGFGYTQPTGDLTRRDSIDDFARAGGELSGEVGYRVNPNWLVGLYGGYARYHAPGGTSDDKTTSATGGVQAQYHITPFSRVDPWIGIGAGYRGFFINPGVGASRSLHGIQLARARVGFDYRVSEAVALGPVIGVDLTMFTTEHFPGGGNTQAVESDNLTVTPFFYAGLAGRFDIGKHERAEEHTVAMGY
jgi:hypothetical protein